MLFSVTVSKEEWVAMVWEVDGREADGVPAFYDNSMIGNLEEWRLF